MELDLQNYHRKIKLAAHFDNPPTNNKRKILPFVGPSLWTPPLETLPPQVKNLIDHDLKFLKKNQQFMQEKPNIIQDDWKSLINLKRLKTIIIKPADKGSAIVILSREQYVLEANGQLQDINYYKKLEKPLYLDSVPLIRNILESLKKKKYINAR